MMPRWHLTGRPFCLIGNPGVSGTKRFVPPGKNASETPRSPDLSHGGGRSSHLSKESQVKNYEGANIRNVALVGHSHSGKTSLASAMLFTAGATQRLGRVDEGNTVTDYDDEEI